MQLPAFVLVTSNRNKAVEAARILGKEIEVVSVDLPEIQSNDLIEVLEAKADEAWRLLHRPLVVEEVGLELDALRGFPGPLVKWMLAAVGADGIARIALDRGDSGAVARCAVLLREEKRSVIGEGFTRGRLVLPPRGDAGFGWDPVFEPHGHDQTYAELGEGAKDAIGHRGRAWRDLERKLRGASSRAKAD
jgi:non-canonical purine NTP pyrophosphatase (RdgB/HAM1 family)